MKIEIKSRWTGELKFSIETETLKLALEAAVKQGANLGDADLRGANLRIIRDDVWAVLSAAPKEVEGLRRALEEGKVDGSSYSGECACLVGTIAKVRGCGHEDLGNLKPDCDRPAEMFFIAIHPGDTPENSQAAKIAHEWITE